MADSNQTNETLSTSICITKLNKLFDSDKYRESTSFDKFYLIFDDGFKRHLNDDNVDLYLEIRTNLNYLTNLILREFPDQNSNPDYINQVTSILDKLIEKAKLMLITNVFVTFCDSPYDAQNLKDASSLIPYFHKLDWKIVSFKSLISYNLLANTNHSSYTKLYNLGTLLFNAYDNPIPERSWSKIFNQLANFTSSGISDEEIIPVLLQNYPKLLPLAQKWVSQFLVKKVVSYPIADYSPHVSHLLEFFEDDSDAREELGELMKIIIKQNLFSDTKPIKLALLLFIKACDEEYEESNLTKFMELYLSLD